MLSTLAPTDHDLHEALRLINLLVPFLADYRSTTLHPSIEAAVKDVYSRFEIVGVFYNTCQGTPNVCIFRAKSALSYLLFF